MVSVGEVVRLRAGDIDSEQMIIRIVQSKGLKDRHVMLPAEVLKLLRQWAGLLLLFPTLVRIVYPRFL